jgi:lantibiotic biosynthesis protein
MQQIVQRQLNQIHDIIANASGKHNTFLSGRLGVIFYYYHAYKATEDNSFNAKTESLLKQVFDDLNSANPGLIGTALSMGGAGLGYVVNFLSREKFLDFEIEKEFEELDKYLFNTALIQIQEDSIDYLHGALGVLHYLNEREQTPVIHHYIDTLVEKICERAIISDKGIWFRNYVIKVEHKRDVNFGLSHGLCGILLILINVFSNTSHKDTVRKIIQQGIHFILRHKMDVDFSNDEYTVFPFSFEQQATELSAPNRLAWCYGDLNEVLLLYRAHKLLDDPALAEVADLIGTQTLLRKNVKATMVKDAHFCHGSSGVAQFYKTLYNESGNKAYLNGYEYWIEQTVLLLENDLKKGIYNGKEHDYLEGLIGVAFTLLSYTSTKPLNWSRSVLL